MSGSQVEELVSDHCVVLNLELMAIFEHQDSLRLIRLRSRCRLRNLFRCCRLTLPLIAPVAVRVAVVITVAVGSAGTTAVKNRWPTTVVFFRWLLVGGLHHDDWRIRRAVERHKSGEA